MAKLYELIKEIEEFEFEIDEETGEIHNFEDLDRLEIERDTKIEQLCLWVKNLESDATAYKAEKNNFALKEQRAKNKAMSIRNYIQFALAGKKFKSDKVVVNYRKSEVIRCNDLSKVDNIYLRCKEPTLNKAAVKADLKKGIEVSGCELIEKNNMQIN
nr:MAG TPA: resistance protein [Caudoviricetes sp.]